MRTAIKSLSATALLLIMFPAFVSAQKWSVATNLLDYANFITVNAEAGVSLHKHWSLAIEGRYNPFQFRKAGNTSDFLHNKTLSIAAGARYWPFFVYSGFYYGARMQWQRFNTGGIVSERTFEGDAIGLGVNFGYTLVVTKHLNIEFGIGLWAGGTDFRSYSSPVCGKRLSSERKAFIAPDDIQINIQYTF
ncbi:MAG TPA: DUF3575 domain-containing protein [Candidatus Coprenecus stercoravium]|uniref:DUF3575 domain-containing protein n=1 Tax=Candidatus Coprenecus stercoravium TaxID=2840735 RepID=A0A9D2K9G5_9BACT|nr:DUF3575 domain-containing protein [Candidatus Coprenecus stercoravium]